MKNAKYFLVLLIFFCVFNSFRLLPVTDVSGGFHLKDVGNVLIWLGILWSVLSSKRQNDLSKLNNILSWFIFAYLQLVLIQASLASMIYEQSLLSGLIRARDQFYYGSFFLFLVLIETRQDAEMLMKFLTGLSLILICLALINYFGPTIFHHKMAVESGIRSGIKRAFIPGISIILVTGLWHLVYYMNQNKSSIWSLLFFILFYAMVVFRQTRGRVIALTITVLIVLFTKKRYKLFAGFACTLLISATLLSVTMEKNIFFTQFGLAYENYKQKSGTWGARVVQIEAAWEIIKQHPFFGSGGLVIREGAGEVTYEMRWAAYGADLGYTNFLKYFGGTGFLWMILFISVFYARFFSLVKKPETDRVMANFSVYMFTYILIAEITLDSFYRPHGIIILCLTLAILVNSDGTLAKSENILAVELSAKNEYQHVSGQKARNLSPHQ